MAPPVFEFCDDGIVTGDLSYESTKESKVIRVFVSSTFTDMTTERNYLMRTTYPKLQEYFRLKGFEFQIVDMRWGVREEAVSDHMATSLCMNEIANAQAVSRGVCFLALLGEKYGNCPLPAFISNREFSIFLEQLRKAKVKTDLLTEWYWKDENAVPPHYVLLPLSEKLKYINSKNLDHVDKRIQDKNKWEADQIGIRQLLEKAATLAFEAQEISEQTKHNYFMAVTEREISAGILQDPLASERTICVLRNFNRFKSADPKAWRFADVEDGKVDQRKKYHLQQMKQEKIPKQLKDSNNLLTYSIDWEPNGVDPDTNPSHKVWLEKLAEFIERAMVRVSLKRIEATKSRAVPYDKQWYNDLIHHAQFCVEKTKMFYGRTKLQTACQRALQNSFVITRIRKKRHRNKNKNLDGEKDEKEPEAPKEEISDGEGSGDEALPGPESEEVGMGEEGAAEKSEDDEEGGEGGEGEGHHTLDEPATYETECNKPVIIHGPSGYGKTSIMAKVAMRFGSEAVDSEKGWLHSAKTIKIIRFLGTSPLSCNIRDVVVSVIRQLEKALNLDSVPQELPARFPSLCNLFYNLLWSLQKFPGKILIMLDSIDQLTPEDGAYTMHWLPLNFPTNIHFFVSTISDANEILENAKQLLHEPKCYLELDPLTAQTAWGIISLYGELHKRTLTTKQRGVVLNAFEHCKQPMFLKLAFELAKQWKSFTENSALSLGKTCKELINQLIERLNVQHGKVVQKALQYITASREGLTDTEIEDLLSLDNSALQDVYIYHLPPEASVIRLPPLLWRRVRQQLFEYLVEKEADGTTVVNWYHRQFWEASRMHLSDTPSIHQNLSSYFTGEWANRPKPLSLYKGKKAEYPNASRNAPAMPNVFSEEWPNLRKLNELPYHIINSYDGVAAADLLCDFDFVYSKLRYCGLKYLLRDFLEYFRVFSPGRENSADLVFLKMAEGSEEEEKLLSLTGTGSLSPETIEVKIVYDLLAMTADILFQSWQQLGAHVVGRLPTYWRKYSRIDRMVLHSQRWLYSANIPLLVPQYPCFQAPGGLLRASINHVVHIPGRNKGQGLHYGSDILYLSDKGLLYVREQVWDQRDAIMVYNIYNQGEIVQVFKFGYHIHSNRFLRDEKFMLLRLRDPSAFDPQAEEDKLKKDQKWILIDMELKERKVLEKDLDIIIPAHSEKFIVGTHDEIEFSVFEFGDGKSIQLTHTDAIKTPEAPLTQEENNSEVKEKNLTIISGALTNDDRYLILARSDGALSVYDLQKRLFVTHYNIGFNEDFTLSDHSSFTILTTRDNRFICRGLSENDQNFVKVYFISERRKPVVCSGSEHRVDILILHQSEKWIAGATKYLAEGAGGGVKDRLNRPLYIWNTGTGEVVYRIKGNRGPFSFMMFFGEDHQYLSFSRLFDPGQVFVSIGGPGKKKFNVPQVLKLGGHSKAVGCMAVDQMESTLITSAADNTIKLWDLNAALALCKLADGNTDLQKPLDKRKKKEKAAYRQPNEEMDPYRFIGFRGTLGLPLDKKDLAGCHAFEIKIAKDPRYVMTGCVFGRLGLFDLVTREFLVIKAHVARVKRTYVQICEKQDFLVSAAIDGPTMWDYTSGGCLSKWKRYSMPSCDSLFLSGSFMFLGYHVEEEPNTLSGRSMWSVWDMANNNFKERAPLISAVCSNGCLKIAASSDASKLITWNGFEPKLFDVDTGEDVPLEDKSDEFTPHLTTANWDKSQQNSERPMATKIGPDDRYGVVTAFRAMSVIKLAENSFTTISMPGALRYLQFLESDPDRVMVSRYRAIDLVRLEGPELEKTFLLHSEFIEMFNLCCEEQFVVTASQDKTLRIWHWDRSESKQGDMHLISSLTFHCPLRLAVPAPDLSFIAVGPESAAPIAILTLNANLRKTIRDKAANFPGLPTWLNETIQGPESSDQGLEGSNSMKELTYEEEDPPVMVAEEEEAQVWEISTEDVKLYISGSLSLSISRSTFDSCWDIAQAFSSSSSSSSSKNLGMSR